MLITVLDTLKNSFTGFLHSFQNRLLKALNNSFLGKFIHDMINSHIMMYHEAQEASKNKAPKLKDLLPPPNPSQMISNLSSYIEFQNESFGHASDEKDIVKKLKSLSLEDLNRLHESVMQMNKSLFEDKDFSFYKVEKVSNCQALEMQNELDSRGVIEIKKDDEEKNEK